MAIQDSYTLLSTAVRIASSATLSPTERLKSLARFIKQAFRLQSVVIYFLDPERRTLSRMLSANGPAKVVSCSISMGEDSVGLCALHKSPVITEPSQEGAPGTLCLPLMCGKKMVGVISLAAADGVPFSGSVADVLQDILIEAAGLISTAEVTEGLTGASSS